MNHTGGGMLLLTVVFREMYMIKEMWTMWTCGKKARSFLLVVKVHVLTMLGHTKAFSFFSFLNRRSGFLFLLLFKKKKKFRCSNSQNIVFTKSTKKQNQKATNRDVLHAWSNHIYQLMCTHCWTNLKWSVSNLWHAKAVYMSKDYVFSSIYTY